MKDFVLMRDGEKYFIAVLTLENGKEMYVHYTDVKDEFVGWHLVTVLNEVRLNNVPLP